MTIPNQITSKDCNGNSVSIKIKLGSDGDSDITV